MTISLLSDSDTYFFSAAVSILTCVCYFEVTGQEVSVLSAALQQVKYVQDTKTVWTVSNKESEFVRMLHFLFSNINLHMSIIVLTVYCPTLYIYHTINSLHSTWTITELFTF